MKKTWVEISCDYCGNAEHFPPGNVDSYARGYGWIITRDGKHYCSKECRKKSKPNPGGQISANTKGTVE